MLEPVPAQSKVLQILSGARSAFVELGYEGTTVDEIARRARVSKPTLYSHIGDKRVIFAAVLKQELEAQARNIFPAPAPKLPIADGLLAIAQHYISYLLTQPAQDLFRIAVAEAQRFPEIGRAFYDAGPGLGAQRLAAYLKNVATRGEVAIDDFELAAHQFIELCRADVFYRQLLRAESISLKESRRVASAAVQLFLSQYRGRPNKKVRR